MLSTLPKPIVPLVTLCGLVAVKWLFKAVLKLFNAAIAAVDNGLSASEVLLTLLKPTVFLVIRLSKVATDTSLLKPPTKANILALGVSAEVASGAVDIGLSKLDGMLSP